MSGTQSWHATEIQEAPLIDTQCTMFVGSWLFGTSRCEEPSTHHVIAACVHEHVGEWTACEQHADLPGTSYCNACTDGPESHECPVTLRVTELPEVPQ